MQLRQASSHTHTGTNACAQACGEGGAGGKPTGIEREGSRDTHAERRLKRSVFDSSVAQMKTSKA